DGIAILYRAPHSYTGQEVLELQGHGGPLVLRMLQARCLQAGRALGARLAEPGEFTLRAFLHDRIDLAQAEAVAALIDASTATACGSLWSGRPTSASRACSMRWPGRTWRSSPPIREPRETGSSAASTSAGWC